MVRRNEKERKSKKKKEIGRIRRKRRYEIKYSFMSSVDLFVMFSKP